MTAKEKLYEIIFEADSRAGKRFDVVLMVLIVSSVLVVVLESIPSLKIRFDSGFVILEWLFTILFTIEYILRIYSVHRKRAYIFSFYGIVDFLSILPTYLTLFIQGPQYFLIIRALRLLRIFRVLKLTKFISGQIIIMQALRTSAHKIMVFLMTIVLIVTVIGALMYVIEGPYNPGFSSIPQGIYWAVVTLTTVGFGDITPITDLGKFLSVLVMILGYSIIAVPTGIISAEMMKPVVQLNTQVCGQCGSTYHRDEARYCDKCGTALHPSKEK